MIISLKYGGIQFWNELPVFRSFEGEIPGAAPEQCGNYSEQNLAMAKYYIARYRKDLLEKKNFIYR